MGRAVTCVIAIGIASGVASASISSQPGTAAPAEVIEAAAAEQSAADLVLMGAGLLGLLLLGRYCQLRPARSVIARNNSDSCREHSSGMIETASPLRAPTQRVVEVTEDPHSVEILVRDARPVDSPGFDGLGTVRVHDPRDRQVGRVAFETCHDLDGLDDRDPGNRAGVQAAEKPVLEIRIALAPLAADPISSDRN
ncbi:MAG: hypothetical protein E2O69_09965 [Deltaproteobacteria bacterium]|nr:MAG: hypothetical protein E2O69_09965 [Deltaproteobacteria bacterium]